MLETQHQEAATDSARVQDLIDRCLERSLIDRIRMEGEKVVISVGSVSFRLREKDVAHFLETVLQVGRRVAR